MKVVDFSAFLDVDGRFRSVGLSDLAITIFTHIRIALSQGQAEAIKINETVMPLLLRDLAVVAYEQPDFDEINRRFLFLSHRINRRWQLIKNFLLYLFTCHQSIALAKIAEDFIRLEGVSPDQAQGIRSLADFLEEFQRSQHGGTLPGGGNFSRKTQELCTMVLGFDSAQRRELERELDKIGKRNEIMQKIIFTAVLSFAEIAQISQMDTFYFRRFPLVVFERVSSLLTGPTVAQLDGVLRSRELLNEVDLFFEKRQTPAKTAVVEPEKPATAAEDSKENLLDQMIHNGAKGKLSQAQIDEILKKFLS